MELLKLLKTNVADLIASKKCLSCENINQQANYLCINCFDKLRFINNKEKNDLSVVLFSELSKELIYKFKFAKRLNYGKLIANYMAHFVDKNLDLFEVDVIVFVPISRRRMFFRGFNQSALLAKIIAKAIDKPLLYDVLRRKHSIQQSKLTAKQRKMNLIGKISLNKKKISFLKNKTILLVDDVKTTGTTLKYCQNSLNKAKPKQIINFTFTRTDLIPIIC